MTKAYVQVQWQKIKIPEANTDHAMMTLSKRNIEKPKGWEVLLSGKGKKYCTSTYPQSRQKEITI